MEHRSSNRTVQIAIIGGVILAIILAGGTIWMGRRAHMDTVDAVRSVSLLYLDELAGRREQVVEENLNDNIRAINIAIEMITDEDLTMSAHASRTWTRRRERRLSSSRSSATRWRRRNRPTRPRRPSFPT